jgi:benzoyl-CoA reductase/2-hydroxyglutaryl-CoA dehydratase subunit BcrC/BadD/HgdB
VPLILIDTPFVYTRASDHAIEYVKRQLEDAVPVAERVAGKSLDAHKFKEITRLSKLAAELWLQVMERGKHRPAPIPGLAPGTPMAPSVALRGAASTVDCAAAKLKEIDARIAAGIGGVKNEKKRLLWDNLPIWYRLRYLGEKLGEHGVAVVASTYTNAWAELAPLFDPENPIESGARTYLHPILNRGTGYKLATMKRMIDDFQLDGAILHSDRSCKPYSIGQIGQRDRLMRENNVPALLLEADHNDPRAFAEEQVANRLDAFVEMLEGKG